MMMMMMTTKTSTLKLLRTTSDNDDEWSLCHSLHRERDTRDLLEAERSTVRDMKLHLTSCSPDIIVNLKREAESLQNLVERQNENHRREMEENGIRARDLKKANAELRDVIQRQNGEIEGFHQVVGDLQVTLGLLTDFDESFLEPR